MPIAVRWFNDQKTILLWDFTAPWTFEDAAAASALSMEMGEAIDHQFDLLILSGNTPLPANALHNMKIIVTNAHPRQRSMVILQAHAFTKTVFHILRQLQLPLTDPDKLYFTEVLEDGLNWLAQKAPILPPSEGDS